MARFIVLVALLAGCATAAPNHILAVRRRAAYDFQCPEHRINVKEVGDDSYAADGCSRAQTYTCAAGTEACEAGSTTSSQDGPPPYLPSPPRPDIKPPSQ